MCPFRSPLQPWQLARVDERPSRDYHQERPVPGAVAHRGQQAEPEAAVERCQAFLPMGRCELWIFLLKLGSLSQVRVFLYLCFFERHCIE